MKSDAQHRPAQRLLVIMPAWVGDTVMATPTLRALRNLYPQAQITALIKSTVRPIIECCPWIDRIVTIERRRKGSGKRRRSGPINIARRLAAGRFDTTVIFPNSFRTALMAKMAGIRRRVGYDRDGRGFLLTDRLLPRRTQSGFVPVATVDYYLGIASYLGAIETDKSMALFTRTEDDRRAMAILQAAGIDPTDADHPLILLNPGASYGEAKKWFPERFAAVADRCVRELGAHVAVSGAPRERPILDQVLAASSHRIIDLSRLGVDLALLKSVVKVSRLMITNDTGPRHIAAALGVPVVTIFGATDPAWTRIDFPDERKVLVPVECGPCQKKKCPLKGTPEQLQCLKRIDPAMVFEQVADLLRMAVATA